MRKITLLLFLISSFEIAFAQSESTSVKSPAAYNYSLKDTITIVAKPASWEIIKPLFEIDNKYSASGIFPSLNPQSIKSLEIEKGTFNLNGKNYSGKIKVTLKPEAESSYLTIAQLVSKYAYLKKGENFIYSIDGEIITEDPKSTLVNEKNIMQIKIYQLDYIKRPKNLNLVKILTRTPENISRANQILIR